MQRGFAAKELEWVQEEDVLDVDAQDAACPYTAAVSQAEGMSEEALAHWIESFPPEGQRATPAVSHQSEDDRQVGQMLKTSIFLGAPYSPDCTSMMSSLHCHAALLYVLMLR